MTDDEYTAHLSVLTGQAGFIEMLPLDELAEVIERAETVGHLFVAPMEFMAGIDNLRDAKELIGAYLEVRKATRAIKARAIKRAEQAAERG